MTLFKKFTDFCAGIAAFAGGLFLLQEYMNFTPLEVREQQMQSSIGYEPILEETEEIPSKLKQFFTPEYINDTEYRLLFILVLTLIVSVLVGRIFKRLPYVCFLVSLLPAIEIVYGFAENLLYTQVGLFLIVGALHIAGNIVECILRDKEDGRHRLWIASKISMLFPAALCLFFIKIASRIPTEEINEKFPFIKDLALEMTEPNNIEMVSTLGWMFFIISVIGFLLYNVYFVDAIISAIPLGYSIYLLYAKSSYVELTSAPYSENTHPFHPEIFVLLAAICFVTNLALCVFENNLSRKEQLRLKEEAEAKEEAPETEKTGALDEITE